MTRNSASAVSTRRRAAPSKEEDSAVDVPPSRIPIKSPARRSSTTGGMAVAYSPIKSSSPAPATPISQDYAKKLAELKNAMDLLKTPPPPSSTINHSHNAISYTPIKSSTLTHETSLNDNDNSLETQMDLTDTSVTLTLTSNTLKNVSSPPSTRSDTLDDDNSLLDAYNDEEHNSFNYRRGNVKMYSSPVGSITTSPYLSSDELKKRLDATKEAFQRSLEAQKRRLRSSFEDIDSSFSTCSNAFDSDLSIDSLNDTKLQLERIRKDVKELIESDFEDVRKRNNKPADCDNNLILSPQKDSVFASFLKYSFIFAVTSIIFTFIFVNCLPSLENVNLLEKIEETLNFILQDN